MTATTPDMWHVSSTEDYDLHIIEETHGTEGVHLLYRSDISEGGRAAMMQHIGRHGADRLIASERRWFDPSPKSKVSGDICTEIYSVSETWLDARAAEAEAAYCVTDFASLQPVA